MLTTKIIVSDVKVVNKPKYPYLAKWKYDNKNSSPCRIDSNKEAVIYVIFTGYNNGYAVFVDNYYDINIKPSKTERYFTEINFEPTNDQLVFYNE